MTDLTERLRDGICYTALGTLDDEMTDNLMYEAATTLETLTQENARLKAVSDDHFRNAQRLAGEVAKRDVENARLREALEVLQTTTGDYIEGYLLDELEDPDFCGIGGGQHAALALMHEAEQDARKALGGGDE